ncbi:hypothetical protein GUJ93_ZPchr0012g20257 [Zizania palustris]|uniref:Uncharacterized protein n=1 Tax=Zizania palustris TaxID=103762 RepID=A0A8J5WLR0_ZIZPA|nr:hypothetical protein GUJ93_ZPchr0012g20257 [Zizania palustris]
MCPVLVAQSHPAGDCTLPLPFHVFLPSSVEVLATASADGRGPCAVCRAVLGAGRLFAVMCLRDTKPCAREESHQHMDRILDMHPEKQCPPATNRSPKQW